MSSRICTYNVGVDCDTTEMHCAKCGWNPKVDKERRAKLRGAQETEAGGREDETWNQN